MEVLTTSWLAPILADSLIETRATTHDFLTAVDFRSGLRLLQIRLRLKSLHKAS